MNNTPAREAHPVQPKRRSILRGATWGAPALVAAGAAPSFATSTAPVRPRVRTIGYTVGPLEPAQGQYQTYPTYVGGPDVRLTWEFRYVNEGPDTVPPGSVLEMMFRSGVFVDDFRLELARWETGGSAVGSPPVAIAPMPWSSSGDNFAIGGFMYNTSIDSFSYTLLDPLPVGRTVMLRVSAHLRPKAEPETGPEHRWRSTPAGGPVILQQFTVARVPVSADGMGFVGGTKSFVLVD